MQGQFRLYNTLSRSVEPLVPLKEGEISLYTCGPTVYGRAHIGNLRAYIFEDTLVKALKLFGFKVNWVMNITDVGHLTSDGDTGEDKLEVGAKRDGVTAWEVAKMYEALFIEDIAKVHIATPTAFVRATDTIQEQIEFIQALEAKGYTYLTSDGVYFDSSKVPDYGKLARLDIQGLEAGSRVEMLEKRHSIDFALWKFTPAGTTRDMQWESPWGMGFPGWHIECSAIIKKALGEEIDLHCGGIDHIPVHHTNEIAQSESLTGKPLARHWAHSEFLLVDGTKMSKSLDNLYTLSELPISDPLAFRLFCFSASYRSKLNFSLDQLPREEARLKRFRRAFIGEGEQGSEATAAYETRFKEHLFNELNLPAVLALLEEVISSNLSISEKRYLAGVFDTVLSLDLLRGEEVQVIPEEVENLFSQYIAAREAKNFELSDSLRTQLSNGGYQVEDTSQGSKINKRL